jgi:acyl carrier protein
MAPASREATFGTIRDVICEVIKVGPEEVLESNEVIGLRNVDSMALLQIVTRVEGALDLDLDVEVLFDLKTVGEFVDTCHNLRAAQAAGPAGVAR